MDAARFLQDLTVVLLIAAAALLLMRRLGLPPVLGYLAAGLVIGPHTPPMPLVTDVHTMEALAEIGVVFLLFALGVEFNLRRLMKVGLRPLLCAGIEAGVMIGAGTWAAARLGWTPMEGVLLGAVTALASTAIVARTLLERVKAPSGWEELVAGMLIAEDIIAVLLITFFSSAASMGEASFAALPGILVRFGMLAALILGGGLILLPPVLRATERTGMEEVRSMVVIGVCFGVSLLTHKLGYSAALGAFLAGAVASSGGPSTKLHETVAPLRDVFGAVFFVSVGMLIDPAWLISRWELTLGVAAAAVAVRVLANFLALAAAGETPTSAVQASLAMLPIGEFSFILAQLAQKRGLTDQPLYPLAVTICLATTLFSAQLLPAASPERLGRLFPRGIVRFFDIYRAGLRRLTLPERAAQVWVLVRPSMLQIVLNVFLVTGLFLGASAMEDRFPASREVPGGVWAAACLLAFPFLTAVGRKTQAVLLILLEAAADRAGQGAPPAEEHPWLTRLILYAGAALVASWFFALGASLLPPWPFSLAPLLLIALLGFLWWRRMARLYSLIQGAMRESLARGDAEPEAATIAVSVLAKARSPESVSLTPLRLEARAWAVGKSMAELGLRAQSGASLIQINRAGRGLPSPGPQVRLEAGDELLLIGEGDQVERAAALLSTGEATPGAGTL